MNSKVRGGGGGFNETNLAISQDTDIPQLYLVGQDSTAKPVSEALASFVTDAGRKKLDPNFLEATKQKCNRPLTLFHMGRADSTRLQIVFFITSIRDAAEPRNLVTFLKI